MENEGKKTCSWCQEAKSINKFYCISKKTGKLRGQCKTCMRTIKRLQRDPNWRPPCTHCGALLDRKRLGGRRLCEDCLSKNYSPLEFRTNGSRRLQLKPCRECGGPKERFDPSRYCRSCREKWKGLPLTNKHYEVSRGKDLFIKYGITVDQYDQMLKMGNGGCWICGRQPKKMRLAVEHDHGTTNGVKNRVRGLACHICNKNRIGINTPETAKKVLDYLVSDFDGRDL